MSKAPHDITPGDPIDEAVEFLGHWYGNSPRQLVSIVPDGPVASKCLWPQEPETERDWIKAAVAGRKNVYFHVNQPSWALDKRAGKKDVRTVRALHIDIDPSAGETPEACKERVLPLLAAFAPPPSVVLNSGGGLQAFWMLDEPINLDGTPEAWSQVERYNISLEKAFGADSCHNVDRIMRLPGTVNVPNKKKLAKGRTAVLATIVRDLTTWNRHPLNAFKLAPVIQQAGASTQRGKVVIPGNLERFASTDDLPVALQDYTKMLIVHGQDVDDPTKYRSRSEALWRVCCDMVRARATDEIIAAVLLDPGFKISSSVLDKSRPEVYAAEQIGAAREEAIDPALRELNARHAVIESGPGGKCVVIEEDWDEQLKRLVLRSQPFESIRNRYMHRSVTVGTDKSGAAITMPLGKWWLLQPLRRQYRKVLFWPNHEVPADQYNRWKGFAFMPHTGSGHVNFLSFIRDIICGGNQKHFEYFIGWLARMVQFPDRAGDVAIILRGNKGTGKSFAGRMIGRLFGQHFLHVSSPKGLLGEFNAHLRDCIFLLADEAFLTGDKRQDGVLKSLVTEPTLTIEAKGVDVEFSPNYLHIMMASNEDAVVPATAGERRYFVLQVSDARTSDHSYFRALEAELDNGGFGNLLNFLLNYDLSDFEHRKVPSTPALYDQMHANLPPAAQYLLRILDDGVLPNSLRGNVDVAVSSDVEIDGRRVSSGLYDDARRRTADIAKLSPHAFGAALRAIGCIRASSTGGRAAWRFPKLQEARRGFDRKYGPYDWNESVTKWSPVNADAPTPF